ncbi:MAG: YitT family protein [Chitinophagaceae bacterium]
MRKLVQTLIVKLILDKKNKEREKELYSNFELALGFRELKIIIASLIKDVALVGLGIFCAAFGLKGFLIPNNFIDGGATGISLLIAEISKAPLYIVLPIINIPFIFLGIKVVNTQFAIKTALAISGLAICVATLSFPDVTHDKLLVAIFGGFLLGAGIGFSVRGGAVIDGTEVLALYLSKKLGSTIGDIIVLINIIIFSSAAYLLSIETAMYSMITYIAASKTLDFIVEGIEDYTGITIISSHHEEIRQMIIHKLGRGVTVYSGKKGYGKKGETQATEIIYTVITRLELSRMNTEIEKIDPHAFVVMSSVKDTKGGMIKKRALKH